MSVSGAIQSIQQYMGGHQNTGEGISSSTNVLQNRVRKRLSLIRKFRIPASSHGLGVFSLGSERHTAYEYRILKVTVHPGIIRVFNTQYDIRFSHTALNRAITVRERAHLPFDYPLSLVQIGEAVESMFNRAFATTSFYTGGGAYCTFDYNPSSGIFSFIQLPSAALLNGFQVASNRTQVGGPLAALGIDVRSEGTNPTNYPVSPTLVTHADYGGIIPTRYNIYIDSLQQNIPGNTSGQVLERGSDTKEFTPIMTVMRSGEGPIVQTSVNDDFTPIHPLTLGNDIEIKIELDSSQEPYLPNRRLTRPTPDILPVPGSPFDSEILLPEIEIEIEFNVYGA